MQSTDPDLFFVWDLDDIDSSFYTDEFDPPRPLYYCLLMRGDNVLESLGGIDVKPPHDYAQEVEAELLAEFEARREACLVRGEN